MLHDKMLHVNTQLHYIVLRVTLQHRQHQHSSHQLTVILQRRQK